jgi:hypothetical protein
MSYPLGRLAPHPESTHPRVHYKDHRVGGAAPAVLPINWYSRILTWGMLLNDQLGDCTAAGLLHLFLAMTTYAGDAISPTNAIAESLYERFGYNPADVQPDGTNPTDKGAVEQDVLQDVSTDPVDGCEVAAFAQVDHTNQEEMQHATSTFGGLYLGIACPESMQEQFAAGEVIDYVPGSPVEGGHCVIVVGWDSDYLYVVTWGALVKMTWRFWEEYGDEAWVVISKSWLEKNGTSPSGLNLQGLLSAFKLLQAESPAQATARESVLERILEFIRKLF